MRFGVRIALVRGVIMASMASTSIWNVSGVTSTNTGTMPLRIIGAISVEKVTALVMISSPGSRSSTSIARYSAELPELHITPRRLANSSATRFSMAFTFLPMRSAVGPARNTSTTASISRSSWTEPAYSMRRSDVMRLMVSSFDAGLLHVTGDAGLGVRLRRERLPAPKASGVSPPEGEFAGQNSLVD
ncbi:unannotated protein [freshwater metagenome]|uniref:Unannotated protein n=1 Tax=freshwater metagenome TaxID=449393 RepID=A0A6J5YJ53_9ZZZZ